MDERELAAKIGDARRSSSLTQQQLCQKSGLSYSTLAKIERGAIKSPSVFTIQQIAEALGTSLDALLGIDTVSASKRPKKRSKSGVEFVYFDINGCLVRFFHRAFAAAAQATGASPDVVETTFWHYNDAVCRGELPMEEFNAILARQFNVKGFDWMPYYMAAVDPIKETAELLDWAHEHYRIGLLSNIMPGFIAAMIESGILPDIKYDQIIDSSDVKAIKPEPEIYNLAAEKTGLDHKSIMLIDDSRANLMAAGKLGWHVLWFDDYDPVESVKRIKAALEF
ncbi:HAD-IA family hydrolase [Candidatus Parcubacteria bacterium]|nr:HAD-IA family hydrolase [Candidatus Parcubacteria bacterium]